VRLVEMAFKPGWRAIESSLALLPGPTFEIRQQLPPSVRHTSTKSRPVTLVFHLGGLTYAELSAYRYLSLGREGSFSLELSNSSIS
jgi:vacuolar protein sorting-associated protein 33A